MAKQKQLDGKFGKVMLQLIEALENGACDELVALKLRKANGLVGSRFVRQNVPSDYQDRLNQIAALSRG